MKLPTENKRLNVLGSMALAAAGIGATCLGTHCSKPKTPEETKKVESNHSDTGNEQKALLQNTVKQLKIPVRQIHIPTQQNYKTSNQATK